MSELSDLNLPPALHLYLEQIGMDTPEKISEAGAIEVAKTRGLGFIRMRIIRDALSRIGLPFDLPQWMEAKPKPTERDIRMKTFRKLNAQLKRRAKERGLQYP